MARPNHYATLGVSRTASQDEIKRAYRRLTLELHPDRTPEDGEAAERFRLVSEAYDVLGDADKRAVYDRSLLLPEPLDFGSEGPAVPSAREFFGSVFGDVFGSRRRTRRSGRDVRYTLTVDLEEAVLGSEHRIEFEGYGPCSHCEGTGGEPGGPEPETCPVCTGSGEVKAPGLLASRSPCGRCDGTGMVHPKPCSVCMGRGTRREAREYEVRVPAGTESGAERMLEEQGEPGRFGGDPGHLRVTINVRPHPFLSRKGDSITTSAAVSIGEAALGAKIEVPTVDGWVSMEVPAGLTSGNKLRLRGKGVPGPKGGRGDQIVTVHIETPQLDAQGEVAKALRALDSLMDKHADLLPRRQRMRDAAKQAAQRDEKDPS